MAAEDKLIVIYSGIDARTGASKPVAVPIGELLDALEETARSVDGRPVREVISTRHTLQPFDRGNFLPPTGTGPATTRSASTAQRCAEPSPQPVNAAQPVEPVRGRRPPAAAGRQGGEPRRADPLLPAPGQDAAAIAGPAVSGRGRRRRGRADPDRARRTGHLGHRQPPAAAAPRRHLVEPARRSRVAPRRSAAARARCEDAAADRPGGDVAGGDRGALSRR